MYKGYKWYRIVRLRKSSTVDPHLPKTWLFNKSNLNQALDRFSSLIIKPSHGSGGYGILQVKRLRDGRYAVYKNARKQIVKGRTSLYAKLRTWKSDRPYIIQQRIHLAAIHGRPLDIRVMVQRTQGEWRVTGKLAKVAGKGYFVTNLARSKGYVLPIQTALTRSTANQQSVDAISSSLDLVALRAAEQLTKTNNHLKILGIDMGVDPSGKVWIIETNYAPMISLFRHLKDRSMYRRILRYKKSP